MPEPSESSWLRKPPGSPEPPKFPGPPEREEPPAPRQGAVLVRYRDLQLGSGISSVVAGLSAWGLVVAVKRPGATLPGWGILVFFLAMAVVFQALIMVGAFGDKASYRAAVPLTDADVTLAEGRKGLRHFGPRYGVFFVVEIVVYSALAMLITDAQIVFLFLSIVPFLRVGWIAWWERRYGVLLWETWEGEVRQPRRPVTRRNKEPWCELYTTPGRESAA
jgi:hypothetical protein